MSFRVELSARAESDVREAYRYIREYGPANPDQWKQGLEAKLASLETMPERCGLAPESEYARIEIRQLLYGGFRILFLVRDSTVFILTIRHGARKFLTKDEIGDLG